MTAIKKRLTKLELAARAEEEQEAIAAKLPALPRSHIAWHDTDPPRALFTEKQMRDFAIDAVRAATA